LLTGVAAHHEGDHAPPERRNRRELLRLAGLVSLTSATWIVAAFAYAYFANR